MNSNDENNGAPLIGSTIDSLFLPVYDAADPVEPIGLEPSLSIDSFIPASLAIDPVKTNSNENDDNDDCDALVTKMSEAVYDDLLDDVTFGLILQMHRAAKLDYITYVDADNEVDAEFEKQYQMYTDSDVLGVFSSLNETFKGTSKTLV
jgi:hypothetical protein